jgi:phage terminase large subunit-like protein
MRARPTSSKRSCSSSTPPPRKRRKELPAEPDETTEYARRVVAGEFVVCEHVRRACQRHLDDLSHGHKRGLHFDAAAAQAMFAFIALLRHSKGRWAGQSFTLELWQKFIIGSLFGWKRADGTRRFRVGHVEVARKNGKTTIAAAVGLALVTVDGEQGAEVYNVATTRPQARLTHTESIMMVKRSTALASRVQIFKDSIVSPATNGRYMPLAADSGTLDGLNVSGAIADEVHAWRDRLLWDVIETACGARTQPLTLITTTAGYDKNGIWWERRKLAINVLDETVEDDSLFAYIATLDKDDDWTDERVWIKGNPNLGVTISIDDLRKECAAAKATPGKQPSFRRLRLNQPTEAAAVWFDLLRWDACEQDFGVEDLIGRECYIGLDLSSSKDLTAAVYWFPPDGEGEPHYVLARFWLPAEDLYERGLADSINYAQLADQGFLETIDGRVIDYQYVEKAILEDAQRFRVKEVVVDRYLAIQTAKRLMDEGLEVVGFGQGFLSMAPASKEFERILEGGVLRHNGHPLLRWCVGNVAAQQDAAGNRKPSKDKSNGRIDGVVAMFMAVGRATVSEGGDSCYEDGESLAL